MAETSQVDFVTIHGHRRAFVRTGSGPVLLLLHGMACDHTTWLPAIERLSRRYTVVAPDFLGHGQSDKPRGDYSIAGYANAMRDLLTVLGIDKATVVGHSLGGGVAMQFAYQYPERTQRLVLVAPGGLGPEVTPLIKAVTLPGFSRVIGLVTAPLVRQTTMALLRRLGAWGQGPLGHPGAGDLREVAGMLETLRDPAARRALQAVVRGCVDVRGQVVTMVDRAYLTQDLPLCVIWGVDDPIIPSLHTDTVREVAERARVELMDRCGHFPHKDRPDEFAATVEQFVESTQPATYSRARWRALLRNGAPLPPQAPPQAVCVAG